MLAPGGRALFDRMGVPPHNRAVMSEAKPKIGIEQELKLLERRLDELLGTIAQLHEENRALRQRQDSMMAERATLLQKNEQVRARVEAMIGRLKAMEHSA
jgi:cell division protein ZapB